MSLQQLLSIFTSVEAKLPEGVKSVVAELKQVVELVDIASDLKRAMKKAIAKKNELPDPQKMRDAISEAKVWIEILRQDTLNLLSNDAYNHLLVQKKSLTHWLSQIILELVRIDPQNNKENNEYICPISLEPVTPDAFPLMDGYLYATQQIIAWFNASKSYNYPQRNAPLSDVDKIAVMMAQGLDISEEVLEDAIELDKIDLPKPAAPAPQVKAAASIQKPPAPADKPQAPITLAAFAKAAAQANPPVAQQIRPQVPLPPLPAANSRQSSRESLVTTTHDAVAAIIAQRDRLFANNNIQQSNQQRAEAERDIRDAINSLPNTNPGLWNRIRNSLRHSPDDKKSLNPKKS